MRVVVTGSSGKVGSAAVAALSDAGHEVLGFDLSGRQGEGFTRVDLADYGQTLDALLGVTARHDGLDAVVHLAAIPVNGLVPDAETYLQNTRASFDVLFAAHRAGIRKIVMASSVTAMGYPFEVPPPMLPVDESVSAAYTSYGLGKVADEAVARQLASWHPKTAITALRFTNVVGADEYAGFARANDPSYRRDLVGSYVDVRDAATAVLRALEVSRPGFEIYNVAAPDSGLEVPSAELARLWFPGVPLAHPLRGHESLMATEKARTGLGFVAEHLWREELRRDELARAELGRPEVSRDEH